MAKKKATRRGGKRQHKRDVWAFRVYRPKGVPSRLRPLNMQRGDASGQKLESQEARHLAEGFYGCVVGMVEVMEANDPECITLLFRMQQLMAEALKRDPNAGDFFIDLVEPELDELH